MKQKINIKKNLPSLKSARDRADSLLTPLIALLSPHCLLCGRNTEVAHHHVHKSKSTRLRYDLDNLIPLCGSCHFKLHQNESFWAGKIIEIKGLEWFQKLDRTGQEIVKADVHYFINKHEELLSYFEENGGEL
ncbi:MAG: HNH endonuclease signature motif containing protein [Candidatus Pacebacteria bacterium]|nr:HNH endonuclease signature motif containing protein [Candidatus Paceibacterota bacterium]